MKNVITSSICVFLISMLLSVVSHAQDCAYYPEDTLFKEGNQVVENNKGPNAYGSLFKIWLPNVKSATNTIREIQLHKNDVVHIDACGCVQTGGSGDTWKRFVNPSGDNSDRLYHGLIYISNAAARGFRQSPTVKDQDMVRIEDLIARQNKGYKLVISKNSYLTLGYEDDNYNDNGYWGHDDGNDDQCKDIGGAIVWVSVDHNNHNP